MLFHAISNEGDAKTAFFIVIVRSPVPGEFDRCAHVFKDLEVVVQATLRDANLCCTIGGLTGGFQMDEIVEPDKAMQ